MASPANQNVEKNQEKLKDIAQRGQYLYNFT